jgi:putative Holliday junction resolvase
MRWLCLDPGEKRTGVALSSPTETYAIPLTVLEHGPSGLSMDQLDTLLDEHWVDAVLIGVPVSMDNTLSTQSRSAIRLAIEIARHLCARLVVPGGLELVNQELYPGAEVVSSIDFTDSMPVVLWDERLSTWGARKALHESGQTPAGRESRSKRTDAHAAAVILQSYFDSVAQARAVAERERDDQAQTTG